MPAFAAFRRVNRVTTASYVLHHIVIVEKYCRLCASQGQIRQFDIFIASSRPALQLFLSLRQRKCHQMREEGDRFDKIPLCLTLARIIEPDWSASERAMSLLMALLIQPPSSG